MKKEGGEDDGGGGKKSKDCNERVFKIEFDAQWW